jgi:hypothetical protein
MLPIRSLDYQMRPVSQPWYLFPALVERRLTARHRHYPPRPGRIFCPLYIPFLAARTLPLVTGRTKVELRA